MDEITQLQKKHDESNAYKYFLQLIKKEAEREKTELSLLTTLLTLMDHHYMESIDTDTRLEIICDVMKALFQTVESTEIWTIYKPDIDSINDPTKKPLTLEEMYRTGRKIMLYTGARDPRKRFTRLGELLHLVTITTESLLIMGDFQGFSDFIITYIEIRRSWSTLKSQRQDLMQAFEKHTRLVLKTSIFPLQYGSSNKLLFNLLKKHLHSFDENQIYSLAQLKEKLETVIMQIVSLNYANFPKAHNMIAEATNSDPDELQHNNTYTLLEPVVHSLEIPDYKVTWLRTTVHKPDVRTLFYDVQTFDDYFALQEQIKKAMIYRGLWTIEEVNQNYKYVNLKTSTNNTETATTKETVADTTIDINLPSTYTSHLTTILEEEQEDILQQYFECKNKKLF